MPSTNWKCHIEIHAKLGNKTSFLKILLVYRLVSIYQVFDLVMGVNMNVI